MSFKDAVANVMAGGKYGKDAAGAIVAEASRNASPEAKRKNPKLNRVKGKSKKAASKKPAKKTPSKKPVKKRAKKAPAKKKPARK